MSKEKKYISTGLLATFLFHVAVVIILILTGFKPFPPPFPAPEGIIISFGNSNTGFDDKHPSNHHQATNNNSQEKNLTQDDVEVPALNENHDNHVQTNHQNQQNNTEENDNEQQINENALFHASDNGGNNGNNNDNGNQGDENGSPDSNSPNNYGQGTSGISYSLNGRSATALPKPTYPPGNVSGKVVLNIKVDKDGNVIAVSLGKGGTTINKLLVTEARKAAWRAKFNPDQFSIEQTGTITYNFKLH